MSVMTVAISSAVLCLVSFRGVVGPEPLDGKLASFRRVLILQLVILGVMIVFLTMAPQATSDIETLTADPAQATDPAKQLTEKLRLASEHRAGQRELREKQIAPLIWLLATLLPAVPLLRALQSFVLAHRLDLDTRHRIAAAVADPER